MFLYPTVFTMAIVPCVLLDPKTHLRYSNIANKIIKSTNIHLWFWVVPSFSELLQISLKTPLHNQTSIHHVAHLHIVFQLSIWLSKSIFSYTEVVKIDSFDPTHVTFVSIRLWQLCRILMSTSFINHNANLPEMLLSSACIPFTILISFLVWSQTSILFGFPWER